MQLAALDAAALQRWAAEGLAALVAARARLDRDNVFPVADGDTGTNLVLTLEGGVRTLAAALAADDGDEPGALGRAAAALADGALRGAQGNSGGVLAQVLGALATTAAGRDELDGAAVRRWLVLAEAASRDAVDRPVEGTVLTVLTAAAAAAASSCGEDADVHEVLEAVSAEADAATVRTTSQLDVLREAGVVDVGALGLALLLRVLAAVAAGSPAPALAAEEPDGPAGRAVLAAVDRGQAAAVQASRETPDVEVQHLLDATPEAVEVLRRRLRGLGDSLVVTGTALPGDVATFAVHVHVRLERVGDVLDRALETGRVSRVRLSRLDGSHRHAGPALAEGADGAHVTDADVPPPTRAVLVAVPAVLRAVVEEAGAVAVVGRADDGGGRRGLAADARRGGGRRGGARRRPGGGGGGPRPAAVADGRDRRAGRRAGGPGRRRPGRDAGRRRRRHGRGGRRDPHRHAGPGGRSPGRGGGRPAAPARRPSGRRAGDRAAGRRRRRRQRRGRGRRGAARRGGRAARRRRAGAAPRRHRAAAAAAGRRVAVPPVDPAELPPDPFGPGLPALRERPRPDVLDRPVAGLVRRGVDKLLLELYGVGTVHDLLRVAPRRVEEAVLLTGRLGPEHEGRRLHVVGRVTFVRPPRHIGGGRLAGALSAELRHPVRRPDGTTAEQVVGLVWFARRTNPGYLRLLTRRLQDADQLAVVGEVRAGRDGRPQIAHPQLLDSPAAAVDADPRPVYPSSARLAGTRLADAVAAVLPLVDEVVDPVSPDLLERVGVDDLRTALRRLHQPRHPGDLLAGRRRLALDEALAVQLVLARRRADGDEVRAAPRPPRDDGLLAALDARLPFELTPGQREVGDELARDLAGTRAMTRLLQGDVGSGKTLVALRAALQVVDRGGQVCLLAPTEVLAAQHHRSLVELMGPLADAGRLGAADSATRVVLVTGSQRRAERREAMLAAADGTAGIVVGTHALLGEGLQLVDLGLVVVDEQHRFGVEQRDVLRERAEAAGAQTPHLLVMTATPIPRTVALTSFGDLEVSTLRDRPPGRAETTTHVVPEGDAAWMRRTWERVREEVESGGRAYVVCPRISSVDDDVVQPFVEPLDEPDDDEPEADDDGALLLLGAPDADRPTRPSRAVLDVHDELRLGALGALRLAPLHGRMPGEEKDGLLQDFAAGRLDVLVSTTVVEVGVDVPDATVMVVLDADRFGVAQLHQLRGRVGRASRPGLCLLVTALPADHPSHQRLRGVAATTDGFRLAELDLADRREGDVLGAAQSGTRRRLRFLDLLRGGDLVDAARAEAVRVVGEDVRLAHHADLVRHAGRVVDDEQAAYLARA